MFISDNEKFNVSGNKAETVSTSTNKYCKRVTNMF